MKNKILVCGSLGFVLSNFIRFFLYRTKGYEIISIDNLENEQNSKHLYVHKNHSYSIGNICDYEFMKKIIRLYEPDIIINGVSCGKSLIERSDFIKGVSVLNSFNIPVIQLIPNLNCDESGMWKYVKNITNNLCIEFPNCFGRRQKTTQGIGYLIKEINSGLVSVSDKQIPWVYVEDVASLIWFCMEKEIKGLIKMPELGFISTRQIAEYIKQRNNLNFEITIDNEYWDGICFNYKSELINGWQPELEDLIERIEETVRWYDANKWASV